MQTIGIHPSHFDYPLHFSREPPQKCLPVVSSGMCSLASGISEPAQWSWDSSILSYLSVAHSFRLLRIRRVVREQAISLRPFCRTLGCSALSWTELPRTFLYGSGCAISFHPLGWISRSGTWGHMVNTCLTLQEPAISSPNCFYQPEGAEDMFL